MQFSPPSPYLGGASVPCPPMIFTARLALRALTVSDYRDIALGATPDLAGEIAELDTSAAVLVRDWVEHACAEVRAEREIAFTIRRDLAQPTLGVITLRKIDHRERRAQLCFWLRTSARGRGYATEAAGALATFAFDVMDLSCIDSVQAADDDALARVLTRRGFARHGLVESAAVGTTRSGAHLWSLQSADVVS